MIRSIKPLRAPRVALLGCGIVGSEVARRVHDSNELSLCKVLVRDIARDRGLPTSLLTDSFDAVLGARPDLVIELIGGVEPALGFVRRSLESGVSVVAATLTLIAHHGALLREIARSRRTDLAYEASALGGVPVLAGLEQLRADRVSRIEGVVSGSCNFILSAMSRGLSYEDALKEAGMRGYVEPDPTADISGRDSAEKLCVLAASCGAELAPAQVEITGIERVSREDCARARRSRRVVRLVARVDIENGTASVAPTLIRPGHPLYDVNGCENAVVIEAECAGRLVFRGPGAGPAPTASAVLGDALRLLGAPPMRPIHPLPIEPEIRAETSSEHEISWSGHVRSPGDVLRAVRSHGSELVDVVVTRSGGVLGTRGSSEDARRLAASLSEEASVMAVL